MQSDDDRDDERTGIRLSARDRELLREIAARWFPGEQRKQSETLRRLIREEYDRLKRDAHAK